MTIIDHKKLTHLFFFFSFFKSFLSICYWCIVVVHKDGFVVTYSYIHTI